ncbi:MAG: DUF4143 domain-containing protein [Chitinivibrionales bacterium]|nr:DUF4143 domain-containing protein [Chitinivibrionales bacterium]
MYMAVLHATLDAVAQSIGTKFIYSRVGDGVKRHQAKQALDMLSAARVCHTIRYTPANGLPLASEAKDTFRKVVPNDVGLLHALLRMPIRKAFPGWDRLASKLRGQLTEQLVGQLLWELGPVSGDGPELYYWQREGGRPGEIDYITQITGSIVPVELKSGAAGSMKSLHQFMFDKKLRFALRFDGNPPSQFDLKTHTTQGDEVTYRLRSLPWYLAGLSPELPAD